jgi:hypothetical protein
MWALIRLLWWLFWWVLSTVVWMIVMAVWPFLFLGTVLIIIDEEGRIVGVLRMMWKWYWAQREKRRLRADSDDDLDASQL